MRSQAIDPRALARGLLLSLGVGFLVGLAAGGEHGRIECGERFRDADLPAAAFLGRHCALAFSSVDQDGEHLADLARARALELGFKLLHVVDLERVFEIRQRVHAQHDAALLTFDIDRGDAARVRVALRVGLGVGRLGAARGAVLRDGCRVGHEGSATGWTRARP